VAPVLYATLAEAGYFPKDELLTLRKLGSRLQGHPGRDHGLPGIEISSGSLGQGLGVAVGMALGQRQQKSASRVFCIMGDGELQEGSVWESAMSAAHYNLSNLTAIVDRNGLQIDGSTEKVMRLEPLKKKWEAFGWHVEEVDGHNIAALAAVLNNPHSQKPTMLLAQTIMGKGVPEIEDDYRWHGKAPDAEEAQRFLLSLY
jgi:transketolase